MRLDGKTAIVTGGGSGFGAAIAELFAAEGAQVVVADIDGAAAERVAAGAPGAVAVQADVTRDADTAAHGGAAIGRLRPARHPGQQCRRLALEPDADRGQRGRLRPGLRGQRQVALLGGEPRRAGDGGRRAAVSIVNTASTAGLRPRPGLCWYNGSKGACILITKSMAVELAPQRIRVNALCPVAGETPLLAHFIGGDTPENRARFVGSCRSGGSARPRTWPTRPCGWPPTTRSSSPAWRSRSTAGAASDVQSGPHRHGRRQAVAALVPDPPAARPRHQIALLVEGDPSQYVANRPRWRACVTLLGSVLPARVARLGPDLDRSVGSRDPRQAGPSRGPETPRAPVPPRAVAGIAPRGKPRSSPAAPASAQNSSITSPSPPTTADRCRARAPCGRSAQRPGLAGDIEQRRHPHACSRPIRSAWSVAPGV